MSRTKDNPRRMTKAEHAVRREAGLCEWTRYCDARSQFIITRGPDRGKGICDQHGVAWQALQNRRDGFI
mgnify:FL=1